MSNNFEVCVRVFIVKNNKLLLCRRKDRDYFFFPGGHIEFGEKAEDTLRREIQEEIDFDLKISEFVGINENYFIQDQIKHHEFSLVFSGEIADGEVEAKEDYLLFKWINLENISDTKIYPEILKAKFLQWFKDRKIFWSSQFYDSVNK